MFSQNVLAVSGAIFVLAAAVPMQHQHHQRDYVWVTATEEEVVTVAVTQTVWIEPGESAPTAPAHDHSYGHGPFSSFAEPTITMGAASSTASAQASSTQVESSSVAPSSSATYVAPASTSSTSVYVAPAPSSSSVAEAASTSFSSVYVAPTTSTSVYVAPTPSSTYVAPTTEAPSSTWVAPSSTSSAPAATSSAVSSGGSGLSSGLAAAGTKYTGDLTYYDTGLGSCGLTNTAADHIVAISHIIFDSYPDAGNSNNNPVCGKYVTITGADGQSYSAQVVDRCTGCAEADLDLSTDFFNKVTNNGDGRVHNMNWVWA